MQRHNITKYIAIMARWQEILLKQSWANTYDI